MARAIRIAFLLVVAFAAGTLRADESEPELISLYQYKPIYFLMGNPYTKIQVSFKAQLVRTIPLYFGYTQLMFWDLFIRSPKFHDLNYNPDIFYRFDVGGTPEQWIDVGPFEHESNGIGDDNERSWNRATIRYHTKTSIGERMKLFWDIKLWVPYYVNPNNEDITRYRGSGELTVSLSDFMGDFVEKGDLSLRLYPGGASTVNPLKGGQELTFRAKGRARAFLPLFVAQIFHGFGENLLDLEREHWGFRVGLGF